MKPGDVFGSQVVTSEPYTIRRRRYVMVRCACGAERPVMTYLLAGGESRHCRSCNKSRLKHGGYPKGAIAPEYSIWVNLRYRCSSPNAPNYHLYGGRGIKVCARWQASFEAFLADMGPRPSSAYTIDRIDNAGDYEPENCRWATGREQSNNRRNNHLIEYQGRSQTATQWARELGLKPSILYMRLRLGWAVERAFRQPVRPRSKR